MIPQIDVHDKAYFNLRKRYGYEKAREIISFWNHFHIDSPASADEALLYFLGFGE
jgi:hypothetical protein